MDDPNRNAMKILDCGTAVRSQIAHIGRICRRIDDLAEAARRRGDMVEFERLRPSLVVANSALTAIAQLERDVVEPGNRFAAHPSKQNLRACLAVIDPALTRVAQVVARLSEFADPGAKGS